MGSRRFWTGLLAQALVFACGGLAIAAWRTGLPANAVLLGLIGAGVAVWTAGLAARPAVEARAEPEPPAEHLDRERARRTLQAFLDQAPTPLVSWRPGEPASAVNRAARRLFRTDDVLTGPAGEAVAEALRASPDVRRTVRLTEAGIARTYAISIADVTGMGVTGAEGALRLAALTDIEAELQAAEAAALRELLQVLSHELMNSLTPLASLAQSAAEVLADGRAQDLAVARTSVAVIARRAEGLHRFVEAYRRLARLPPPAPRRVSVAELLAEAAQLFETRWAAQGVRLELVPPRPDILIRLDPDLTAQALLGLLTNAAEAALAGGRSPPTVRLSAQASGAGAAIAVSDNGPGVPADQAAEIFRPFFTTKPEGAGIGLALARQAVVSQGGQLLLEPSDEGASFLLAF
ncbi:ATP-binding protein [Phenylobacterium sp.]|uniref:sensor histidine kinase n=1 Tax=Phenylobacterium sp. TaxID=1871053 RepID=UPI001216E19F|nr:ATP-binding protein [Phenylobacterium sp.]THD61342.1 MAG: histidine kinase [Phenylobacterium sp.]